MLIHTVGHGTSPIEELIGLLSQANVHTVVDVRRYPGSRRNPQFNQGPLETALAAAGIGYRHALVLGGRLANEPGAERFACIRVAAFRSYAARMTTAAWQQALDDALAAPVPCLMCSETAWPRCHRRLIAELLHARGHEVRHLVRQGQTESHSPWEIAESRHGRLYLCGEVVA
jgi:uncharacterized protein (DUF488 family)